MVRVEPRLLNDVLVVALRQHGLSVHACPAVERRAVPRRTPRHFDAAVVTESLPRDAEADTVIVIDESGAPVARDGAPIPGGGTEHGLQPLLRELRRALDEPARCETP